MPSPFPGMAPYLEPYRRDIHTSLMVYARDQIQEQLPRDLMARVEEDVSIDVEEETPRTAAPDVSVVEEGQPDEAGGGTATATAAVTAAAPLMISLDEEVVNRHIEILDASSGNRVVTVIEFLSPTNKLPGADRDRYRRKQHDYIAAGINLVEIDLIREGVFTVAVPIALLPATHRTQYLVCVRRAAHPRDAEVYRVPLREPLPAIRIPLRPRDADVVLRLQELITQCYQRGRYDRIDYSQDPMPVLTPADAHWADQLLRQAGRRQ